MINKCDRIVAQNSLIKGCAMNIFYHGDCLFVLKHDILPDSIDLIYLDPPFFTGKIQKGTKKWQPGYMEISFEDSKKFWGESKKIEAMRKRAPEWLKYIAIKRPVFASYLYYMMERLDACHRVLKPTGSIYLHCDYRASHYLKMVMDEVFFPENFQNEIVWHYKTGGTSKRYFSRKHDTIFMYSKSDDYKFYPQKEKSYLMHKYGFSNIEVSEDKLGFYTEVGMRDVWDIPALRGNQPETMGYPTQKPKALLRRIIIASSTEGDLVLDPFCGCGTAIVAAHELNRRWIGIDVHRSAYDVSKDREVQMPIDLAEEFAKANYISRDLEEVRGLSPSSFESWVNEFYYAEKPYPDKGIDGITPDGIPIQVKTNKIGYKVLSQFITDAEYHPNVAQPITKVVVVSQIGFDDEARQRKFEIETKERIEVSLITPEDMLKLET